MIVMGEQRSILVNLIYMKVEDRQKRAISSLISSPQIGTFSRVEVI